MFQVRTKTDEEKQRKLRVRSDLRDSIVTALVMLTDDEVISFPTDLVAHATVRARVHDVNKKEARGELVGAGKGKLATEGVKVASVIVETRVMRRVLK